VAEASSFTAGSALNARQGTSCSSRRELHRFEDFTDDLAVWVVFFGPLGGEVVAE
jgi:hypothetical protein